MISAAPFSLPPSLSQYLSVCSRSNCGSAITVKDMNPPDLSLHFNGHFPGEPRLACVYWSKGWWTWWWQLDYWSYRSCKAPVKSSPPTNQLPVFTGRMSFLSPNQQCQSTEGKISHSMDLLTPSSPGGLPTLSLTTNSSWLRWGRVAMLLISPLMPVPHADNLNYTNTTTTATVMWTNNSVCTWINCHYRRTE